MKQKIIRDSVHGYISIPEPIVDNLIDTEFFQRLRRIEQTTMRPLFPCARHDRFIHSIGVYYLGEKVFDSVKSNTETDKEYLLNLVDKNHRAALSQVLDFSSSLWEKLKINFSIACLLHDVGHSPMSHTLEDQFKVKLYSGTITEFCGMPQFWEELESGMNNCCIPNSREKILAFIRSGIPATHEVLSAIIVVKELRQEIEKTILAFNNSYKVDYEFIIRCIMGVKYDIPDNDSDWFLCGLKNAFISLLHGKVFDVDRLDYLKRDCLASGMDSSNIDVERLIKAISLYIDKNNTIIVSINKSALSVIDEHIGAYNDLYLWVYSHHKVILTAGLMRRAFEHIDKKSIKPNYFISNLFSYQNLVNKLLSDDDIWCEIKNNKNDTWEAAELIIRGNSRLSLWKSVAEFRDLFVNLGAFNENSMGVVPIRTIFTQIGPSFEIEFTQALYSKLGISYKIEYAQDVIFEKVKIKEMNRKKWEIPIIIDHETKYFSKLMDVNQQTNEDRRKESLNEICFYAYIKKDSQLSSIPKNQFAKYLIDFMNKKMTSSEK